MIFYTGNLWQPASAIQESVKSCSCHYSIQFWFESVLEDPCRLRKPRMAPKDPCSPQSHQRPCRKPQAKVQGLAMSDRLPINNSLKGAVQLPTHMGTLGCWVIPPGPVCSSLCNLIIISSLMKAMLMQVLVWTPCQCELETNSESPLHTIPLNLPPSSWITGAHHNSQQSLESGYVRQAVHQTRTGVFKVIWPQTRAMDKISLSTEA